MLSTIRRPDHNDIGRQRPTAGPVYHFGVCADWHCDRVLLRDFGDDHGVLHLLAPTEPGRVRQECIRRLQEQNRNSRRRGPAATPTDLRIADGRLRLAVGPVFLDCVPFTTALQGTGGRGQWL